MFTFYIGSNKTLWNKFEHAVMATDDAPDEDNMTYVNWLRLSRNLLSQYNATYYVNCYDDDDHVVFKEEQDFLAFKLRFS